MQAAVYHAPDPVFSRVRRFFRSTYRRSWVKSRFLLRLFRCGFAAFFSTAGQEQKTKARQTETGCSFAGDKHGIGKQHLGVYAAICKTGEMIRCITGKGIAVERVFVGIGFPVNL